MCTTPKIIAPVGREQRNFLKMNKMSHRTTVYISALKQNKNKNWLGAEHTTARPHQNHAVLPRSYFPYLICMCVWYMRTCVMHERVNVSVCICVWKPEVGISSSPAYTLRQDLSRAPGLLVQLVSLAVCPRDVLCHHLPWARITGRLPCTLAQTWVPRIWTQALMFIMWTLCPSNHVSSSSFYSIYLIIFWDKSSLCSPGYPEICHPTVSGSCLCVPGFSSSSAFTHFTFSRW